MLNLVELGINKKQNTSALQISNLRPQHFSKNIPNKIKPVAKSISIMEPSFLPNSKDSSQKTFCVSELNIKNDLNDITTVDIEEVLECVGQFRTFGSVTKQNPEFYKEFRNCQSHSEVEQNLNHLKEEVNHKKYVEYQYEHGRSDSKISDIRANKYVNYQNDGTNNNFDHKFDDYQQELSEFNDKAPLNKTEKIYNSEEFSNFNASSRST